MSRVLVVDDEFGLGDALADVLRDEGYDVEVARNGALGLGAMRARRPDVVLLDYMMPVMDGQQVLQEMKGDPKLQRIPVVVMTAVPAEMVKDWIDHVPLLRKPFELDRLFALLTESLARA
jgi:CheY-like chemotaxis protein